MHPAIHLPSADLRIAREPELRAIAPLLPLALTSGSDTLRFNSLQLIALRIRRFARSGASYAMCWNLAAATASRVCNADKADRPERRRRVTVRSVPRASSLFSNSRRDEIASAVRGMNTTSPLLRPTPSPPAAMDRSRAKHISGIKRAQRSDSTRAAFFQRPNVRGTLII